MRLLLSPASGSCVGSGWARERPSGEIYPGNALDRALWNGIGRACGLHPGLAEAGIGFSLASRLFPLGHKSSLSLPPEAKHVLSTGFTLFRRQGQIWGL